MRLYYLSLLLTTPVIFGMETCVMKQHVDTIAHKGEFLLCANSGNSGVDCAVFSVEQNTPTLLLSSYIKNEDITTFTEAIASVVACVKNNYGIVIKYACFAGPGVPSEQRDFLKHFRLPYQFIDAKDVIAACQLSDAFIVNDFLAMSYGIDFLDKNNVATLYDAPAQLHGNRVIIGAGSGLGTVSMVWNDCQQAYTSFPAEAGTGNFPPFDQFEFDLMIAMKKVRNFRTTHWAFFVSLPAIEFMHQILQDMNYENCSTSETKKLDAMTILASAGTDACCNKAADLFYKFYARFVYNFVWNTLPFGGIYLVGETATQHPEMLKDIFLPEYFNCVETKLPNLQRIPVYIIKDDKEMGLYGIAKYFIMEKKELFGATSLFEKIHEKVGFAWSYVKKNMCC